MTSIYIGIDNGVTGSIGIIGDSDELPQYLKTPVRKTLSYTKKKQFVTRVDVHGLRCIIAEVQRGVSCRMVAVLERPMVNPTRFKASESALRALEATLIVLEGAGIAYQYIDSKEWQRALLPSGIRKHELKIASMDVGMRLFPTLADEICAQRDADGLLIAEYAKRQRL